MFDARFADPGLKTHKRMILPIVAYGSPVLRNVSKEIGPDYPDLQKFIDDMWGNDVRQQWIGLAALGQLTAISASL